MTYSESSVAACRFLAGVATAVLMFFTAIPKLPEKAGVHPAGAAPLEGVMMAVTACGIARGDALTAAVKMARAIE